MKLTLKHYKFLKIKYYLKKDKPLLFYNSFDFHSKTWFVLEKSLKSSNLMHFKLHNKITRKVFDKSIYKKFTRLFSGLIILTTFKALSNFLFSTLFSQDNALTFLGIKMNKMFYLSNQIKTISCLNYRFLIISLFKSLKQSSIFSVKLCAIEIM